MRRRIFIAINLPEPVKTKLASEQRRIETAFQGINEEGLGKGIVRWARPKTIHITLAFIGYINDEELLEVCKATEETTKNNSSFSITLQNICYGPVGKVPPRMIWVTGQKSAEFVNLKNDLEKRLSLSQVAYTPERRGFVPHITLGRIRQWQWHGLDPEQIPDITQELNLSFRVSSIEIMESNLKRGGPEYKMLESHKLGGE